MTELANKPLQADTSSRACTIFIGVHIDRYVYLDRWFVPPGQAEVINSYLQILKAASEINSPLYERDCQINVSYSLKITLGRFVGGNLPWRCVLYKVNTSLGRWGELKWPSNQNGTILFGF